MNVRSTRDVPNAVRLRRKFMATHEAITETGCWIWLGFWSKDGYGKIFCRERNTMASAHRVAYELFVSEIPAGMSVCHSCDVPACCNPAHLFLGTHGENMADMYAKGRRTQRGGSNGRAILNEAQVREIRASSARVVDLAKQYAVSVPSICGIRNRTIWSHVA